MTSTFQLDASKAECVVFTYKEGLLSPVAHDLKIRVTDLVITWDGESLTVRADPGSLRVIAAMKGSHENAGALSDSDKAQIEKNLSEDVLHTQRHRSIEFRATQVVRDGDAFRIMGELSLHGVTQQLATRVTRRGERWTARFKIHQPDYDIKPFSAMLGTLKVKPDVRVQISVPADAIPNDLLPG